MDKFKKEFKLKKKKTKNIVAKDIIYIKILKKIKEKPKDSKEEKFSSKITDFSIFSKKRWIEVYSICDKFIMTIINHH